MSTEESDTPQYVTAAYMAYRLKLDTKVSHPEFNDFAGDASQEMSRALLKLGGDIPAGSTIFPQVRRCATNYALYLYFQSVFQFDQSAQYETLYKASLKTLKESLQYTPTERTEPILEVTDMASERKVPFSQLHYAGSPDNLY